MVNSISLSFLKIEDFHLREEWNVVAGRSREICFLFLCLLMKLFCVQKFFIFSSTHSRLH